MSEKEWLRSVTVCEVHGDSAWYVCYEDNLLRLRLTHRGTWSMDDMDIYWKSQAEAFAALHVAPCPLEDPYARIAELEAANALLVRAVIGADDAKWKLRACQQSGGGAGGQTIGECLARVRYHNVPLSIFNGYENAMAAVWDNKLAAAAIHAAAEGKAVANGQWVAE